MRAAVDAGGVPSFWLIKTMGGAKATVKVVGYMEDRRVPEMLPSVGIVQ